MKQLSFAAIVVIASNTMNGPGLTTLPSIANAAGQVTFQVLVIVAALTTSFVVSRLCSVIWTAHVQPRPVVHDDDDKEELGNLLGNEESSNAKKLPPKDHTIGSRPQLNETDIVALSQKLFDKKKLVSIAMVGCALSLALAQMMLCAAIADSMIVASMRQSCGIGIIPPGIYCTSNLSMKPFLFENKDEDDNNSNNNNEDTVPIPVSVISAGLILASSITVSLAAVDFDSLLTAQYILFACLLLACCRFCTTLYNMGDQALASMEEADIDRNADILPTSSTSVPYWIGSRPFDSVGPTLFNFAFVVTAPPLVCGTDSSSTATRALVVACLLMGVLYMLVGSMGANAAAILPDGLDDNLLSLVLRGTHPNKLDGMDIFAVILFGLSQLAAIPVYCELARETLMTHIQMRNRSLAFAASHILPWVLVATTYNSTLFEAFVEWSSLLLLGFANFSMPLLLDHVFTQRLLQMEQVKLHARHDACPSRAAWGLALITASISAVILQRMTGNLLLAEIVFLGTTVIILHFS